MSTSAQRVGLAGVAGAAVGYAVFRTLAPAAAEPRGALCKALAAAGGSQSLWSAIKGAAAHFFEDGALAALSLQDRVDAAVSGGRVSSTAAADFYAWWNGLTPEQQAAAEEAERAGLVDCAAAETGDQLTHGAGTVTAAAFGALAAFFTYQLALALEPSP